MEIFSDWAFDLCIVVLLTLLVVFILNKSKLMADHNKKQEKTNNSLSKYSVYLPSFLILVVLIMFIPVIISEAGSSDAFAGLSGIICRYLVILLVVIQVIMLVFSQRGKVVLPISDVNAIQEKVNIKKTISPLAIIIRVVAIIVLL